MYGGAFSFNNPTLFVKYLVLFHVKNAGKPFK